MAPGVVSKLGAWNWFSRNGPLLAAVLGGKPFLALILKPPHLSPALEPQMFFMRVGIGEVLVCGALLVALIVIPLVLAWKTRRVNRGE